MEPRRLKFILIGFGIAATMAFLFIVGTQKSDGGFAYYVTVDEFVTKGAPAGHFRVNGKVRPGSIERLQDGERVRFTAVDPKTEAVLAVDYTGIVPDTFVDDADIVVEGRRRDDGVFEATTLLAKCPSKYEAATP